MKDFHSFKRLILIIFFPKTIDGIVCSVT